MPALKDKALALLGSATVDMKTAAATTIFTTPVGKVTRITHVVVRDPTASMAGGTDFKFGTGFRNNAAVDLSSLTTASTDYIVLLNATNAGADQKSTEIAAITAFAITVTTGTTAACNATIDVFGYTV
jgi:hypothetical protein